MAQDARCSWAGCRGWLGDVPVRRTCVASSRSSPPRNSLLKRYASAAVVYRTSFGGLTLNRLTVIGWNTINISLLIALLYRQWQDGHSKWIDSHQRVASSALVVYGGWALFLVLALPYLRVWCA